MAEIIQQTDKKIIYREGKTLVKLFKNNYPKSDVLNEALNTARVEEGTSLNVPAVQGQRRMGNHSRLRGGKNAPAAHG